MTSQPLTVSADAGTDASSSAEGLGAGAGVRKSVIFLHHSVGGGFLRDGSLRQLLEARGYVVSDHGYNQLGLTNAGGQPAGYNFAVPDDNTDPDGLQAIFEQTLDMGETDQSRPPRNTLSGLMRYDIIILKSCFPASAIGSDEQLRTYEEAYLSIRSFADAHPEHLLVLLSTPPLEPGSTRAADAARARAFARWLTSDDFVDGRSNLTTFDLFDALAEPDPSRSDFNTLREEYRFPNHGSTRALVKRLMRPLLRIGRAAADSHPNAAASVVVARSLTETVDTAARRCGATRCE
jgi:hypothetical protein